MPHRPRKRKAGKLRSRVPVRQYLDFLSMDIDDLAEDIRALRQSISMLLEKHDRQYASAIAINTENARLRMHQEKEPDDAAPTP